MTRNSLYMSCWKWAAVQNGVPSFHKAFSLLFAFLLMNINNLAQFRFHFYPLLLVFKCPCYKWWWMSSPIMKWDIPTRPSYVIGWRRWCLLCWRLLHYLASSKPCSYPASLHRDCIIDLGTTALLSFESNVAKWPPVVLQLNIPLLPY